MPSWVSIVVSDIEGNLVGDATVFPFVYRVRGSRTYGSSLTRDNELPELYQQLITTFRSSRGLSLSALDLVKRALIRYCMIPDLVDGVPALAENFVERGMRRLAQIVKRLGREHFLTRWWEFDESSYVNKRIEGAKPLELFTRDLFFGKFPATLERATREFEALIASSQDFDPYVLDEIRLASRDGGHRYHQLILAILMVFYVARLRLEKPEHFS